MAIALLRCRSSFVPNQRTSSRLLEYEISGREARPVVWPLSRGPTGGGWRGSIHQCVLKPSSFVLCDVVVFSDQNTSSEAQQQQQGFVAPTRETQKCRVRASKFAYDLLISTRAREQWNLLMLARMQFSPPLRGIIQGPTLSVCAYSYPSPFAFRMLFPSAVPKRAFSIRHDEETIFLSLPDHVPVPPQVGLCPQPDLSGPAVDAEHGLAGPVPYAVTDLPSRTLVVK